MKPNLESQPKAFIKPEYLDRKLPNPNPFGLKKDYKLPERNTQEYKAASKLVSNFLNRPHKNAPIAKSKIAF